MALKKCLTCSELFELEEGKEAVCPKCKATGDKIVDLATREVDDASGDIPDSSIVDSTNSALKNKIAVDTDTFIDKLVSTSSFTSYAPVEFHYDSAWKIGDISVTLSEYGITISSYTPVDEDTFTVSLSKQTQFRNEIRAKSMLAGITPLLVHAE